jgi:hypothetical protein
MRGHLAKSVGAKVNTMQGGLANDFKLKRIMTKTNTAKAAKRALGFKERHTLESSKTSSDEESYGSIRNSGCVKTKISDLQSATSK